MKAPSRQLKPRGIPRAPQNVIVVEHDPIRKSDATTSAALQSDAQQLPHGVEGYDEGGLSPSKTHWLFEKRNTHAVLVLIALCHNPDCFGVGVPLIREKAV